MVHGARQKLGGQGLMSKPRKTKKLSQAHSGVWALCSEACLIACLMLRRLSQIVWTKTIDFCEFKPQGEIKILKD